MCNCQIPQKHDPYYQLSNSLCRKRTSEFVGLSMSSAKLIMTCNLVVLSDYCELAKNPSHILHVVSQLFIFLKSHFGLKY